MTELPVILYIIYTGYIYNGIHKNIIALNIYCCRNMYIQCTFAFLYQGRSRSKFKFSSIQVEVLEIKEKKSKGTRDRGWITERW